MTNRQEGTVLSVLSLDGTRLSVERIGTGPCLVLVDGAFCGRSFGPARALANELRDSFTVYFYDRRGRGESGETMPYAVEREIEDLRAVLNEAGTGPYVYGISSGAALALETAASERRFGAWQPTRRRTPAPWVSRGLPQAIVSTWRLYSRTASAVTPCPTS